ncbi:MAG: lipopolysaccharide heptosyltransferase II, partial [Pyrinomonadaceae bacterium]
FLAGIPIRIGYNTQGRSVLLTNPVLVPSWKKERHEIFYYLNLVRELANDLDIELNSDNFVTDTSLSLSPERRSLAESLLDQNKVDLKRPMVVICPGSTNSRAKRWPVENFASVADQLINRLEANVILIGAKEELEVSTEVARLMHHQPTILTSNTSLSQTIGVIGISDLVISNDTGPAHIGAALDRPTIVIFGPTNPVTTSPFSLNPELVNVMRVPPDCAPCMLRDCPIDHRCMTRVTHEMIAERAIKVLTNA